MRYMVALKSTGKIVDNISTKDAENGMKAIELHFYWAKQNNVKLPYTEKDLVACPFRENLEDEEFLIILDSWLAVGILTEIARAGKSMPTLQRRSTTSSDTHVGLVMKRKDTEQLLHHLPMCEQYGYLIDRLDSVWNG